MREALIIFYVASMTIVTLIAVTVVSAIFGVVALAAAGKLWSALQ